jgi:hypothetical protein
MADYESPNWGTLGEIADVYRQARQRTQTSDWLRGQGLPDNLSLAQLALYNKRDARDFDFRQQEAQRAQGNVDRNFALQKQQAEEAARGFDYREIDDGAGGKSLVKINKVTGEVTRPDIAGAQTQPNNPFQQGKMNESQSKDALYTSRMLAAEKVLQTIDAATVTNPLEKIRGGISDRIGYNIRSPEYQKFDQAQRDFINATLRRESGAVISDAEFDNARKQYFPQPGDQAETIAQKRANRIEAIKGIGAGAGPGYKPTSTVGPDGSIIANPAAQPKPQAAPQASAPPFPGAKQGRKPDGSPGWFIQSGGKTYLVE